MGCINKSKLKIIYGDVTLGVQGEKEQKPFSCIFSYAQGGLESLNIEGKEWIFRAPKPTFWRALTDNDRGGKFQLRSGMWLAADMFIRYLGADVAVDGVQIPLPIAPENNKYSAEESAEEVSVTFYYETITDPAAKTSITYRVLAEGAVEVIGRFEGREGLPELPVFGIRFIMPTKADGYRYEGLSGETYPDRMAGGLHGVYEIEGMPVTPYLVPQDCGMHMETAWAEVTRTAELDNRIHKPKQSKTLRFEATDKKFAFSCLPYTAEELENAFHAEELPCPRRTVFCVYGAVRGVGGIDSWGADVEAPYRVSAEQDIEVAFRIVW